MILSSVTVKQKLFRVAEIVHLRLFGHAMGEEMRTFLGHLSWSFFGGVSSAFILLIVNVSAGRILGPEEYGKYALILSVAAVFTIPMVLGMDTASVYFIAKAKDEIGRKRIVSSALMTTLILIAVVCILLAFFHNPFAALLGVSDTFLITSLFVAVILSMRILFEAFLRGFGRFKKQSVVRIFESLTVLFVFFVLAEKGGLSYRSYVGAIISGYLVFIVLNLNIFIGFARIEFMKPIGILIRYGSFTVFGSIFGILTTNMDKIFVNMYLGRDQLGIYTAYSTVSLLLMGQLATIFVNVFFQHLSVRDDHDRLLRKMKIIAIVSYLPILLILCVAISVSMAFFGDKYPLDFSLVMQFGFLGTTYLYFLVLWWMINSKGERGIRFTSFSGLFFGLSFIGLLFIFRDTLTIGMVADFLSGLLLVAILWGGLRYAGLKKG